MFALERERVIQDIKKEREATKKWKCSGDKQQQLRRLRALKKYKKRVAKDRANARRGGMKLPAKREAPEDVDNSTSLPPAKRSRRVADMEHCFKYNSWYQCEVIGSCALWALCK